MPLNLPASSETERRHDASSLGKEEIRKVNKTHFTTILFFFNFFARLFVDLQQAALHSLEWHSC